MFRPKIQNVQDNFGEATNGLPARLSVICPNRFKMFDI